MMYNNIRVKAECVKNKNLLSVLTKEIQKNNGTERFLIYIL